MRRSFRRVAIATTLGLVACAPLIGLDELHDRATTSTLPDAAPDATRDADAEAGAGCVTHRECNPPASSPALCVAGKCVAINKTYCAPDLLPIDPNQPEKPKPLQRENPFVVAAFGVASGTAASLALNLALLELDEAGGIPGPPRRDMAVLLCGATTGNSELAVQHVINDLKIPAIIANFTNDALPRIVSDYTLDAGTFVLNANITPEALKYNSAAARAQTVLNLLGTSEDVALSYRYLVGELSAVARARAKLTPTGKLKVALLVSQSLGEQAMAEVVQRGSYVSPNVRNPYDAIEVNGQPPAVGESFELRTFASVDLGGSPDLVAEAAAIAKFEPNIVIALTGSEIGPLVTGVETVLKDAAVAKAQEAGTLEAGLPDAKLPIWVLGPRNSRRDTLRKYLLEDMYESPHDRLARFWGIQFAGSTDPKSRGEWLARMQARYKDAGTVEDYSATENSYDAVYWLAYGLYRGKLIDTRATDNQAIARGTYNLFDLIDNKKVVTPGTPRAIGDSFEILSKDNATYVGALGPPDIDKQFGTWRANGTAYCYRQSGLQQVIEYDNRRYTGDPRDGGKVNVASPACLFPDAGPP